jgi:phage head maturation protease
MNGIGTVRGYACLWNEPSWNLAADGESRFDIVAPRAITFAPDVRANLWHIRNTTFASVGHGTLEIFADGRGVGFAAEIPETPEGYNLFAGLRDGRSLGVSAELCDITRNGTAMSCRVLRFPMLAQRRFLSSAAGYVATNGRSIRKPARLPNDSG